MLLFYPRASPGHLLDNRRYRMASPLRIAFDIRHTRDYGIGTYIRNLLRAMARLNPPERFLLFGSQEDFEALGPLGDHFERHVYPVADRGLWHQLNFPLFYRKLKADLGHIPLNVVPLGMPKPYVVTIHDMSRLKFPTESASRQNYNLFRARHGLSRAERIITVSGATRRDVEDLLRIPVERTRLIYNAIDPRFLDGTPRCLDGGGFLSADPDARKVLERYGIQYPFLLYAGTILPQKNVPRLVEAFAYVRGELGEHPLYKDLRLVIIGDEISKHPSLRRTVIQTRVEPYVRFLGFVPFDVLRALYRAAEVFVFPSLYEGFGLPPLEAMACGTPVVTSDASSLPEVVGDAAILVNPENLFEIGRGIKEVLLEPGRRLELIQKGFEHVRSFSWDRTAAEVLALYRDVGRRPAG
jgi:glycosyltransferase involved in cell wall biosynthesis